MRKELQFAKFAEFTQHICRRPSMYTSEGTYNEVVAYITGYASGVRNTPLSGRNWKLFNRFVCLKFAFGTNVVWWAVLKYCSKDEVEAIALVEVTILDFLGRRKSMSMAKVLEYASKWAVISDGLPERIFKEVRGALLNGEEEVLKKHLVPNDDQYLLWQKAYLTEIPEMDAYVYNNYPIKRMYESADGNKIKLIAADFLFPIEMNLIDGEWKIDATDIIQYKKKIIAERKTRTED
ncbi:MAG: hypothetical protein ACRYFX_30025 [Janthinobacterium lividum]